MAINLQPALARLTRLHFVYIAALTIQLIAYDAWDLLAPTAILQRWAATAILFCVVIFIWYSARPGAAAQTCRRLVFLLILADVGIASFGVYTQRGMAANAVALYAAPLVVASVLRSRRGLFATAIFCLASYITAAVAYFSFHFNEGYKIELYGEVGLYSVVFVLLAGMLAVSLNSNKP